MSPLQGQDWSIEIESYLIASTISRVGCLRQVQPISSSADPSEASGPSAHMTDSQDIYSAISNVCWAPVTAGTVSEHRWDEQAQTASLVICAVKIILVEGWWDDPASKGPLPPCLMTWDQTRERTDLHKLSYDLHLHHTHTYTLTKINTQIDKM